MSRRPRAIDRRSAKEILDSLAGENEHLLPAVAQLLDLHGWRWYHIVDSRTVYRESARGFLDILALRPPRVVVAELKGETGEPTPAQLVWLATWMMLPGVEVYVWRPRDLDRIQEILR